MPRTRKPTKKAPAKRMKPMKCVRPGCRNRCAQPNLICAKHLRAFKRTALYRGIQRIREQHPTPTDSHTRDEGRKLEEVRKYLAAVVESEATEPAINVALGGLRILYSTPTAKGGRK